jgi:hypothetical protein
MSLALKISARRSSIIFSFISFEPTSECGGTAQHSGDLALRPPDRLPCRFTLRSCLHGKTGPLGLRQYFVQCGHQFRRVRKSLVGGFRNHLVEDCTYAGRHVGPQGSYRRDGVMDMRYQLGSDVRVPGTTERCLPVNSLYKVQPRL